MDKWFKKVAIKTIKTMAQTAVGVIGSSALITDVNWQVVASTVIMSGIVCVLMNVSDIKEQHYASNHTISNSPSNRNTIFTAICDCSYLLSVFR